MAKLLKEGEHPIANPFSETDHHRKNNQGMSERRGQKSEVRSQRSEVRSQKAEVRGQLEGRGVMFC